MSIWVEISGTYSNGHTYERVVAVKAPECPGHESLAGEHMGETVYCNGTCQRTEDQLDEWWQDVVLDETGDGVTDPKADALHTAKVIAAEPSYRYLVDLTHEFQG